MRLRVCVCYICSSLVSGGFQCPKHKHAVCFWLCYADVCLIMLSNMVHVRVLRKEKEHILKGKTAKAGVVWFSHHGGRKLRPGPGCTCQAGEAMLDSV